MFCNDFLNLVLVCKDVEQRYGRTRTRGFFSTVRLFTFTSSMLAISFLEHLFLKFSGYSFFKKISFRQTSSLCNLVQLEEICMHQ